MTYLESELSRSSGKPTELYKIEGTYQDYFYTSGQKEVTFEDRVYKPLTMKRSEVKIGTSDDDGMELTVEMPVRTDVIRDYAFKISPPYLFLTVYRFHTLADVKIYWSGPVSNIRVSRGLGSLRSVSTLGNALAGSCPSAYFQTPCNRILFDDGCGMSRSANTVATIVAAVSDRTITLDNTGGKASGFFRAGELLLLPQRERRMVVAHTGNVITVNYPFSRIVVGQNCEVVAGCDHAYLGDCKNKFDNQENFGGFIFIPNINPFTSGLD